MGYGKWQSARYHYVAYTKQTCYKDINVSPSGLMILSTHFFIGASGNGWTTPSWDQKSVLEIKCPFSTNDTLVHCMAPMQLAMEYPSLFMEVHEETICLKQTHNHYIQVQGVIGDMGVTCHFCGRNPLWWLAMEGHNVAKLTTFYREKLLPEILCRIIQQNLIDTSK